MPELPDLQVFAGNLNARLAGKTLRRLACFSGAKANAAPRALAAALKGRALERVTREGKELQFVFGQGAVLNIHLMLRGKLHWFDISNDVRHTLVEFWFEQEPHLALTDFQKKANLTLNPPPPAAPDALDVDADFWKLKLKGKVPIKTLLMNQKIVRGIGNAYADEILYRAKISPFSRSGSLSPEAVSALADAVPQVLSEAEKMIRGRTPDSIGGELRDFLVIHNSKKTHGPSGDEIHHSTLGGRTTYFTDEQTLFE